MKVAQVIAQVADNNARQWRRSKARCSADGPFVRQASRYQAMCSQNFAAVGPRKHYTYILV
jgi:hypothetical protein